MKYKVGDKVRIKSLDWYNENKGILGNIDCGDALMTFEKARFCGKIVTISSISDVTDTYRIEEDNGLWNWTDEMIEGLVEEGTKFCTASNPIEPKSNANCLTRERVDALATKIDKELPSWNQNVWELPNGYQFTDENGNIINAMKIVLEKKDENSKPKDMGEVSDGYHTFNELYEYRLLYNAALFNEFAKQGLYDVHKSKKHSDGEYPFGDSNWFIVMAELPTGQISNHYEMKDWDKFQIPEKPLANKWDEHSPRDVADRLTSFTTPKKEYPKTYDECCKVLNIEVRDLDILDNMLDTSEIIYRKNLDRLLNSFRKLLICRDAYWKIAGEEMGLGKPWEPDWKNSEERRYSIVNIEGDINLPEKTLTKWILKVTNKILVFPTEEMRDAFYENFKEMINQCKELL